MDALNARLAEIRVQQGLDPLPDPTKIQGFEPGAPPPPPWSPPTSTQDVDDFGDDLDEAHAEHLSASPLVDVAVRRVPEDQAETTRWKQGGAMHVSEIPPSAKLELDLLVVESEASYKGHTVTLNPDEKAGIARIILASAQRTLREHLESLDVRDEIVAPAPPQTPSVKKKRGRPRKAGS